MNIQFKEDKVTLEITQEQFELLFDSLKSYKRAHDSVTFKDYIEEADKMRAEMQKAFKKGRAKKDLATFTNQMIKYGPRNYTKRDSFREPFTPKPTLK